MRRIKLTNLSAVKTLPRSEMKNTVGGLKIVKRGSYLSELNKMEQVLGPMGHRL
jgi:hypothetical protein